MTPAIDQNIFDEAIRLGNDSVSKANKYMNINRRLVDAVRNSLALIETGRVTEGRDVLRKSLADTARALL